MNWRDLGKTEDGRRLEAGRKRNKLRTTWYWYFSKPNTRHWAFFFIFYPTHPTSNSNYPLWVFYLHNSLLIEKTTHSTDQFTDHTLLLNQSIFNDRDLNLQHEMDTNRDQILDLNTIWLDPTGWDGLHNQFT